MKRLILALPMLGLLATLLLPAPAWADQLGLNFSLADPQQFVVPPGTLTFVATVSAPLTNTGDVYLNSDSTTVDYPLTLDDTPFFNNFPLSLAPGGSFTGVLFDITVPDYADIGTTYNGYFEIDGGPDSSTLDYLASTTFTVTATPEPGTVILLLAGFAVLAVAFRRRQCRQ
jgi:hypothetical protein